MEVVLKQHFTETVETCAASLLVPKQLDFEPSMWEFSLVMFYPGLFTFTHLPELVTTCEQEAPCCTVMKSNYSVYPIDDCRCIHVQ